MYRISLLLLCLFLLPAINVFSQDLVYQEKKGDNKVLYYHYYLSKTSDQHHFRCVRLSGKDTLEDQILHTDGKYRSKSWDYSRKADQTRVKASLEGNRVTLKGIHDGKRINEIFDLDDYPWIQAFPLNPGLENWLTGEEEEITFWVIGTASSADMDINRFTAEKKDKEKIMIMGSMLEAQRVNITLAGWRSMFWDGDFYFRVSDGRIIKYDGGGPPGEPSSVTHLVKEINR